MSLRTGIDLTSIPRVESILNRYPERFHQKFFSEFDIENVDFPPETYAGLWAVKEAVFKVIGRGYRWKGVRVRYLPSGRPVVDVDYEDARLDETIISSSADWDCSITHDQDLAVAFAVCSW